MLAPTPRDVRDAARRLRGLVRHTPLLESAWLSRAAGRPIYLKAENLQVTGAFKARGAANRLLGLSDDERRRGVVTASAGNHGQGVAWAAARLGIGATVVLPLDAVAVKVEQTRAWGVAVVQAGQGYDEAHHAALELARDTGAVYIHAFEDHDVIAGQGTIALEILDDLPSAALIVAPVGGGGLVSGLAVAVSGHAGRPRVLGVQSTYTTAMHDALRAGALVPTELRPTLADGLAGDTGQVTLDLCRRLGVEVALVPDELLLGAIGETLRREHLAIEGSAAVTVAAALSGLLPAGDGPAVLVLSGGNVDAAVLRRSLGDVR